MLKASLPLQGDTWEAVNGDMGKAWSSERGSGPCFRGVWCRALIDGQNELQLAHVCYVFPNRLQARSRYRAENNPHGEILRKPYLYIVHISLYPLSAGRTACPGAWLMRTHPSFREPGGTRGIRAACPGSRCTGWHRECSAESPSCAVPAGGAGWWHAPVASLVLCGSTEQPSGRGDSWGTRLMVLCLPARCSAGGSHQSNEVVAWH